MIKVNVISNYVGWRKYINNPNLYIEKKIKKLNLKNKSNRKQILFCTILLS